MSAVELNNSSALSKQDLSTLDVTKLTALSPEVISRQATINIGTIGHVAHGKSTVVKAVSGVQTVRFKNELERNITIKLDSADEEQSTREAARQETKRKTARRRERAANTKKRKLLKESSDSSFEVESVVDHIIVKNKHLYLVKWKDWPSAFNTLEPLEHLDNCYDELFSFLEKRLSKYQVSAKEIKRLKQTLSKSESSDLKDLMAEYITEKGISIPPPEDERTEQLLKLVAGWPEPERDPQIVQLLRRNLLLEQLYSARQVQLDALKEWEDEMNSIIKSLSNMQCTPVTVVNEVDLEGPPENFIYINDYLPGEGVSIPDDPPFGCECQPACSSFKKRCCPTTTGGTYAYDKDGRVKVPKGTPIYECNKRCKCGDECANKVVQKGWTKKLCIFRTKSGCGWGVKTLELIPKGCFVTEYVGEVITFEEAERRGAKYDKEGQTYLFDLDFNDENENCPYTVDAAFYGNVSHFVNHSCDPNMTVYAVWGNCLDPNLPKLALFANREIKPGEEISFDYLNQSKTKNRDEPKLNSNAEDKKQEYYNMVCKCGSKKCRKFYL